MDAKMTLFRLTWSHACGVYWAPMRKCAAGTADGWKHVYESDEPTATFIVARKAPRIVAGDETRARHAATL